MAHFIGVVHRKQVRIARDKGVVAFGHGKESLVRTLNPGDTVIYYAPREEPGGDPVQCFVSMATVTGDAPFVVEFYMGSEGWVREARYDLWGAAPVRPMLEDLSFVKNKQSWGMTFRGGKFEIPAADHDLIVAALKGSPE